MFELKTYDFPLTWIDQTLDASCFTFIRNWLELPVSACLKEMFILPRKHGGLGYNSFKSLSEKMRLIKRNGLHLSSNLDIRQVWSETQNKFIDTDELLLSTSSLNQAKKRLKDSHCISANAKLNSLQIQGAFVKTIKETTSKTNILCWSNILDQGSSTIFNFSRKALLQALPTASNLARWNRIKDPTCQLCSKGEKQTNKHVLSNCSSPIALARYTTRHNKILQVISDWLRSVIKADQQLFIDLSDSQELCTSELFNRFRPDKAIMNSNFIATLELTVCHETNMLLSRQYKLNKYANIGQFTSSLAEYKPVKTFTVEVSTLGFISSTDEFSKTLKLPKMPLNVKEDIIRSALNSSFQIYCKRNCNAT